MDNVKKCKIQSLSNKFETEAIIIDNHVFILAPRQNDRKPSHIINEQCYYQFHHIEAFPKNMTHNYIPFSTVCEWDEFMDFSYNWANYDYDWREDTMEELNITNERWGYFNSQTGEIVIQPQWDWCDDFCAEGYAIVKARGYYGVIYDNDCVIIYPDYYSICYVDIKRAEGDSAVFFVKTEVTGKWGAMDVRYSNFTQEMPDVKYNWDDIWWDGWGGFTVMEKTEDGHKSYGIVNRGNKIIAQNLTVKPVRYDVPTWETRQNTYRDGGQYVSFRIITSGEKYGLVVDSHGDTDSSELLIEAAHTYESVLEAAAKEDMEWEIAHYALLICKTPAHITTAWDNVPQDITENVHKYMDARDWKQGAWD
jgi:hypothetical protein